MGDEVTVGLMLKLMSTESQWDKGCSLSLTELKNRLKNVKYIQNLLYFKAFVWIHVILGLVYSLK